MDLFYFSPTMFTEHRNVPIFLTQILTSVLGHLRMQVDCYTFPSWGEAAKDGLQ